MEGKDATLFLMKKYLKQLVFWSLHIAYLVRRSFGTPQEVVVLMYHSIGQGDWEFTVSPQNFEKQIEYLEKSGYAFWGSRELDDFIGGRVKNTRRAAVITFDDGYRDFLTGALPVLRKHNIPALLFIHTNRSSDELRNTLPLLTWEDVLQISKNNIEIGSHSHSHPNVKLLSVEELNLDTELAENEIQRNIGVKPKTYAYPGGKFNDSVIELLKKRGYRMAFTIDNGLIKPGDNSFRLRRVGIGRDTSWVEFKIRVSIANTWYNWIKNIL